MEEIWRHTTSSSLSNQFNQKKKNQHQNCIKYKKVENLKFPSFGPLLCQKQPLVSKWVLLQYRKYPNLYSLPMVIVFKIQKDLSIKTYVIAQKLDK